MIEHPTNGSPIKAAFNQITQIWAFQRTGILKTEWGERATFIDGEPRDAAALQVAVTCLYREGFSFRDADSPARRPPPKLGNHLVRAAKVVARAARVERARQAMLVPGPNIHALQRVPVSVSTRKLVPTGQRVQVGSLLDQGDNGLALDISILTILRVVRLTKPTERDRLATSQQRAERLVATRSTMLLQRLRREWEVMKDADDLSILGVPEGIDQTRLEELAKRQVGRYKEMVADPDCDARTRALAERIYHRVLGAAERVGTGSPTRRTGRTGDLPDEETAFRMGLDELSAQNFAKAVGCFALARKYSPNSGRNVGHLGWAVYNDSARPRPKRQTKGRELLELADVMDPNCMGSQYFLAVVENQEGEPSRAVARLTRVVSMEPGHAEAKKLLTRLKR